MRPLLLHASGHSADTAPGHLAAGNDALMEEAYQAGPLGQTANGPAWAYHGTRWALGTAVVATAAALTVGIIEVAFLGNQSVLVEGIAVHGLEVEVFFNYVPHTRGRFSGLISTGSGLMGHECHT